MAGGLRFVVVTPLCDRLESEVWASEGRLELESKELRDEMERERKRMKKCRIQAADGLHV